MRLTWSTGLSLVASLACSGGAGKARQPPSTQLDTLAGGMGGPDLVRPAQSCVPAPEGAGAAGFMLTTDPQGLIVPAHEGARFFWPGRVRGRRVSGYYTPGCEEIDRLEAGVTAFIIRSARSPTLADRFVGYRRQYVGIVDGGEHWLWVNAFCEAPGDQWKKAPVVVDDGGDCFVRLEFNPQNAAFRGFEMNGDG